MFKNRVRTAALAGTIALATGLSGFSAPAFAQTAQDGYNAGDASASAPVVAKNVTEAELRDRTNATAAFLNTWMDNPTNKEIVDAYIAKGEDGFDPSEQAAQAAFDQARKNATAELAKTGENIQAARNSIAYAKQVDDKAAQDWAALVSALNAYSDVVNPLITDVNAKNNQSSLPDLNLIAKADRENAIVVYKDILQLQIDANNQWDKAGEWLADKNEEDYITREHMAALQALKDAVNERTPGLKPIRDTAIASNVEAQKSDILVRQLFLERATAQRDTLRAVEAYFSIAARYIELYQDTELAGEKKANLRTLYRHTLGKVIAGIQYNVTELKAIDTKALDWYMTWETDLKANDDEDAYKAWKLLFQTITYEKIFINGAIWQEAVERVEGIDYDLRKARQDDIDRAKRDQDLIDAIKDQNKGGSSSFKLSS